MKLNVITSSVVDKKASSSTGRLGGGVVCAVLMPHAPILVPDVGGQRGEAAIASCRAMRTAAACVMRHAPESLVLISPHSPRQPNAFGLWADNPLRGTFEEFSAPEVEVSLPLDRSLVQAIMAAARVRDLATWPIHRHPLDHGAMVPLWFLIEAGWSGPTVILSLNDPEADGLIALGEAIATAAATVPRRIALVASGDMSHRLTPGAPCGFHPQAHRFDETFIQLIRAGEYRQIEAIAPKLRERAAEDAVDSTLIAAAAVNWQTTGHEVLNYEGPFGVGYGVAILFAEKTPASVANPTAPDVTEMGGNALPIIARRSVAAALHGVEENPPAPSNDYLGTQAGVFITLRHRHGKLRGCVGTVTPVCPNIVAETWRNARLAAFQDRRFDRVTAGELDDLRFEVSVLHSPEEIASEMELDPTRYGVIVSAAGGRRGLLLPGIEDIKTPQQQVGFARKKGWISPDEPVKLQRFEVDRFEESA